jgi:hypothetical protein
VAQQRETRDHGEQECNVEPAEAGEDAGYIEEEKDADRDAEERVSPSGGAVAVPVAVPMAMVVALAVTGIGRVVVRIAGKALVRRSGLVIVEEALTHAEVRP